MSPASSPYRAPRRHETEHVPTSLVLTELREFRDEMKTIVVPRQEHESRWQEQDRLYREFTATIKEITSAVSESRHRLEELRTAVAAHSQRLDTLEERGAQRTIWNRDLIAACLGGLAWFAAERLFPVLH